jgi:small subunit ribosomal protein S4
MKRKSKLYSRPQKPFEKTRIEEENKLLKEYALKNKKEVWKALAKINYFRKRAMTLASSSDDQEVFFNKLKNIGFKIESTSDVLDLKVEDLLQRRLPTVVAKKGIANTVKQARQMVVHKKITVKGAVVNTPSYIVQVALEKEVAIKKSNPKKKPQPPKEEEKEGAVEPQEPVSEAPKETPQEPSPTPKEPSPTPKEPSPTPKEPSPTPKEPSPTPKEPSPTPKEQTK